VALSSEDVELARLRPGGELADQARLSDPHLSFDNGNPAVPLEARDQQGRAEALELFLPSDERRSRSRNLHGSMLEALPWPDNRRPPARNPGAHRCFLVGRTARYPREPRVKACGFPRSARAADGSSIERVANALRVEPRLVQER
jgi:hypothetical protein